MRLDDRNTASVTFTAYSRSPSVFVLAGIEPLIVPQPPVAALPLVAAVQATAAGVPAQGNGGGEVARRMSPRRVENLGGGQELPAKVTSHITLFYLCLV